MGFPLIQKMGLKILENDFIHRYSINAQDLERALEKATVVYSTSKNIFWAAQTGPDKGDTHKALLINVEELPREPLKYTTVINATNCNDNLALPFDFRGKKIKITVEEVKE